MDSLNTFIEILNCNSSNLRFTFSSDRSKITFLDLTIFKDSSGCLASTLFRKESAGNTLLHADSAHPHTLIRSIPYAQYLRLHRNCTFTDEFKSQANLLRDRLKASGYSKFLLCRAYNRAFYIKPKPLNLHKLSDTSLDTLNTTLNCVMSCQHIGLCCEMTLFWPNMLALLLILLFVGLGPYGIDLRQVTILTIQHPTIILMALLGVCFLPVDPNRHPIYTS